MTAAKQAKVAKRHVGGKTPVVRRPQRAPEQQDRGRCECHVAEMTTNGGEAAGYCRQCGEKGKNYAGRKGGVGREEQSRARGGSERDS